MNKQNKNNLILLTGASGYVGGRLLRLLEEENYSIRCMARKPQYLQANVSSSTEVVQGDVLEPETLNEALKNVHTAFYLIHSMGAKNFEENDRKAAQNFVNAAKKNNVNRIIYLGGLGNEKEELSAHLRSRHEVGRIFLDSGIPTIEFRASIVIGAGSLSFEMIRSLVRRLPVMITPRWVDVTAQPIYIDDLLEYLKQAIDISLEKNEIIEIGGNDQVSYGDLMNEYARQRGLKRFMIRVPVLTPRLSSLWLGLVTPVYARVGRKLVDSIKHTTVVTSPRADELFSIKPRGYKQSMRDALIEDNELFFNRWSDTPSSGDSFHKWGGVQFGKRLIDSRTATVNLPPERAFKPIQEIGGQTGWYYGEFLWKLRAWLDLFVGGIGMRRGRKDPKKINTGDPIDFWRVEEFIPNHKLLLLAEMKVPGRAWLEFVVVPKDDGSEIHQTAIFDPKGLFGYLYWYSLFPLHNFVFQGMLNGIIRAAEEGKDG